MNQQVAVQANDIHKVVKNLHQVFRETLKKNDGCELHVYERYVQVLHDLLHSFIQYFDCDWNEMTSFYEKRIGDLTSELELYQRPNGDSQAVDLIAPPDLPKIMNKHEVFDDLRHRSEIGDLQNTFSALEFQLKTEIKQLRDENEALKNRNLETDSANKSLTLEVEAMKSELKKMQTERSEHFNRSIDEFMADKKSGDGPNIKSFLTKRSETQATSMAEIQSKIKASNEKRSQEMIKLDLSDTTALVLEIADRHDFITSLRVRNKKLEGRVEHLEKQVKFREKIIRELRRSTSCESPVETSSNCLEEPLRYTKAND